MKCMFDSIQFDLPVYENRPDGLLRGRNELIVLALRCNAVDGEAAFCCSYCVNDDVLLFSRIPWRGDDGHDDVWRFGDPWFIDSRDRDVFDFLRKMPAFVSVLHRPFISIAPVSNSIHVILILQALYFTSHLVCQARQKS